MKTSNQWIVRLVLGLSAGAFFFPCSSAHAYEFRADFRLVPPDMVYENKVPAGPIREMVDLAISRAGHTIVWKPVPWKRTQIMATQGKTDLLVRHSMYEQRWTYLSPILIGYQEREVVFVTAPNKKVQINCFEDVATYVIGEQRGYYYSDEYREAKNLRRIVVDSRKQLAELLGSGRVDAVVMSTDLKGDLELLLAIEGTQLANYKMTFLNARYCSIPKKSPAIQYVDQVGAEFLKMRKSGEITRIMEKHGVKPYKQDFSMPESLAQEAKLAPESVDAPPPAAQ